MLCVFVSCTRVLTNRLNFFFFKWPHCRWTHPGVNFKRRKWMHWPLPSSMVQTKSIYTYRQLTVTEKETEFCSAGFIRRGCRIQVSDTEGNRDWWSTSSRASFLGWSSRSGIFSCLNWSCRSGIFSCLEWSGFSGTREYFLYSRNCPPPPTHYHGWRNRKGSDIEGRGPTYAARSLPQYNSAFATRVLLSTYVCVKGEKAWGRIFKLFRTPAIDSMELIP